MFVDTKRLECCKGIDFCIDKNALVVDLVVDVLRVFERIERECDRTHDDKKREEHVAQDERDDGASKCEDADGPKPIGVAFYVFVLECNP